MRGKITTKHCIQMNLFVQNSLCNDCGVPLRAFSDTLHQFYMVKYIWWQVDHNNIDKFSRHSFIFIKRIFQLFVSINQECYSIL